MKSAEILTKDMGPGVLIALIWAANECGKASTFTARTLAKKTTDVDRTLMSAEANLAGLYPPVKNQIWDSLKWMPIPVHTTPEKFDNILKGSKHCPRYNYEVEKVLRSPEIEHMNKSNKKLYEYLTENSGDNINSFKKVEHLYDVLLIEQLYNKTLPQWTKSVFPDKLKPITIFSFMLESYNKILQRLKSGPLVKEMIDHMVKKAQNTLQPDRKLWIYSAPLKRGDVYDYLNIDIEPRMEFIRKEEHRSDWKNMKHKL
ncbi:hypothetical protein PUN28_000524 [Cardiocondyla obscurior]|uniref:acid phosphatase n=1 Tax=Cardiocondyla obscurior TaxID=286306 RepID=A0AAW2H030_9HYME